MNLCVRACSLTETMVYTQFSGSTSVPILRIPLQRSSASMRETAGLIRKSGFPTTALVALKAAGKTLCDRWIFRGGESGEVSKNTAELAENFHKRPAQSELYDPEKTYNVCTVSELEKTKLMGSLLTEDNLPLLKEYVKLCAQKDLCSYMDMDSWNAAAEYDLAASGMEESRPFEEMLITDIQGLLGFECGRIYCENYYSEETTEDVGRIIEQVIETFNRRIDALDWMSDATKKEAKNKLAELDVRVGHPDSWPQDRYELILEAPEDGGLYIDNYLRAAKAASDYSFEKAMNLRIGPCGLILPDCRMHNDRLRITA